MKTLSYIILTYALLPVVVFIIGGKNNEITFIQDKCSLYCHNVEHNLHNSRLPDFLTGNNSLYENTVNGLIKLSGNVSESFNLSIFQSYEVLNMMIFVFLFLILRLFMNLLSVYLNRKTDV